jgi:hypothetical protein
MAAPLLASDDYFARSDPERFGKKYYLEPNSASYLPPIFLIAD